MFGILAYHAGMFQRESCHSIISAIYYGNVLNSMFGILAYHAGMFQRESRH